MKLFVGVVLLVLTLGVENTMGLKQYVEFYLQTNCENNPNRTLTGSNYTNLRAPGLPISDNYKSFSIFGMQVFF